MRTTVLAAASAVWGIAGFVLAGGALDEVNDDIAWLVTALTILGPLAALAAAWAIRRARTSVAVALLVISLATPTYFAWVLSLIPIIIITVLLADRRVHATH